MPTRCINRTVELLAGPNQAFDLLITPSAVRQWWQAAQAVIVPRQGGVWVASWGDEEDHPDFVSAHRIVLFDPPRSLQLREICYYARATILPFEAEFLTTFVVEQSGEYSRLNVLQDGFPEDTLADEFYHACDAGWKQTLANIRAYIERGAAFAAGASP